MTRYRKKQERQITGNIIATGIFTYNHVGITKLNHFVPIHRTKSMEYMIAADLGGPTGQKPCFQAPKHHSKQQFKVLKSKLKHYQINLLHRGEAELRTT